MVFGHTQWARTRWQAVFVNDDFSPEINLYTYFKQEKKVKPKVFGKLELCQKLPQITSKAQIALYLDHCTTVMTARNGPDQIAWKQF